MSMMTAEILTPWAQVGNTRRPDVEARYPLRACHDITGQPAENIIPEVNLLSVQVECEEEVLAAIEEDAALFVMWSEEVVSG